MPLPNGYLPLSPGERGAGPGAPSLTVWSELPSGPRAKGKGAAPPGGRRARADRPAAANGALPEQSHQPERRHRPQSLLQRGRRAQPALPAPGRATRGPDRRPPPPPVPACTTGSRRSPPPAASRARARTRVARAPPPAPHPRRAPIGRRRTRLDSPSDGGRLSTPVVAGFPPALPTPVAEPSCCGGWGWGWGWGSRLPLTARSREHELHRHRLARHLDRHLRPAVGPGSEDERHRLHRRRQRRVDREVGVRRQGR